MKLMELTVNDFVNELGDSSPAPGGGSAAALAGVLGASLCVMVANLTIGKRKYQDTWVQMEKIKEKSEAIAQIFARLVDRDANAYNKVVAALRLSKSTEAKKKTRQDAIQEATIEAAWVPMKTLEAAVRLMDPVKAVLQNGNPNCITDVGVAAQFMRSAAMGAAYNVLINLPVIGDETLKRDLKKKANALLAEVVATSDDIENELRKCLP